MDADETRGYIEHRLKCVGWKGDPHIPARRLRGDLRGDGRHSPAHQRGVRPDAAVGLPRRQARIHRATTSKWSRARCTTRPSTRGSTREPEARPLSGPGKGSATTRSADRSARLQLDAKSVDEASRLLAKMQSDPLEERLTRLERRADTIVALLQQLLEAMRPPAGQEASQAMKRDPWLPAPGPVLCVVGARPNFMKMAPILRAFAAHDPAVAGAARAHRPALRRRHERPAVRRSAACRCPTSISEVGSGTHAVQTAEVMRRFEPVLDAHAPSCVLVVGDVNSTLACTLVAVKKGVPVAHVEAGLRSFDRSMPEEINRVLTDQIADLLYTTERVAHDNLAREGIDAARAHFVGNVMIDSLLANRALAVPPEETLRRGGRRPGGVRRRERVSAWSRCIARRTSTARTRSGRCSRCCATSASGCRCVFALHPRTRANIDRFGLGALVSGHADRRAAAAGLSRDAGPDVGRDARAHRLRRHAGGDHGARRSVPDAAREHRAPDHDRAGHQHAGRPRPRTRSCAAVDEILAGGGKRGRVPELWDGRAAERIAAHLAGWLARRHAQAAA